MGKLKGFIEIERKNEENIPVYKRLKNFKEFTIKPDDKELEKQGSRCMDCGVPFCHSGCPLGNMIPDFNDAVHRKSWKEALKILHSTNNFPEFTGRLCPAPCEAACVLGLISPPVSIEMIEKYIVERGFSEGWIQPNIPKSRTLYKKNDIVLLCGGATIKRSLPIPGSESENIIQAMHFLKHQNEAIEKNIPVNTELSAKGKNVIVIGGGDTGSDCIGTSNRQGAKSVVNFEIMPKPPKERSSENPWPYWPFTLKSCSSHEEGSDRKWSILTKEFITNNNGELTGLKTVEVKWEKTEDLKPKLVEIANSEKIWPCELVLLALGFTGPEKNIFEDLNLKLDSSNKPITNNYMTSDKKVFAAGDLRRGQSLIVWAISEGREAAYRIDELLMGHSKLPSKTKGDLPLVK